MKFWQIVPLAAALAVLQAQSPSTAPVLSPVPSAASSDGTAPLYRVMVVEGSALAFNYRNLKSSTEIALKGTVFAPDAKGEAKLKSKDGSIYITAKVKGLPAANSFGPEFLTYVLWGVSSEGRATNLGELILKKGKGKVEVTESLQTFGLVVTAEPYFAVSKPSEVVIMENVVSKESQGQVEPISAHYELLKRGQYTLNPGMAAPETADAKTPFDLYQARNAVAIARAAGAKLYAEQALTKAEGYLQEAEVKTAAKKNRIMNAREAVQRAEDSRLIAIKHQEAEQVELTAKANQERVDAAKRSADLAAAGEARAKEQTRVAAVQTQAAEQESANLRSRLMSQLNAVLETRATARGLIVNMSGMLFQPGKATLEPAAREKLAKIAGILSTHKGLIIEADGFTDNTGGDALNQRLSEQRADASRDFLVSQGVASDAIMAKGFGKSNPIAPNDTSKGRKANRRVELVVSGNGVTSYVSSR